MSAKNTKTSKTVGAASAEKKAATATSTKPVINPPREGSKKAKVFAVFKKEGRDAAIKYGRSAQHLKESSLKVWVGAWARSTVRKVPAQKATA